MDELGIKLQKGQQLLIRSTQPKKKKKILLKLNPDANGKEFDL